MSLRFPLFVNLSGRKAVVIGGGTVGLRRAGALFSAGCQMMYEHVKKNVEKSWFFLKNFHGVLPPDMIHLN